MHHPLELDRIPGPLAYLCRLHLPGEAVFIREPTALHLLPAAGCELLPVIIDLLLRLAVHHERTASVNLNCGPPFKATNSCPSSSNDTVMTEPFLPEGSSPV